MRTAQSSHSEFIDCITKADNKWWKSAEAIVGKVPAEMGVLPQVLREIASKFSRTDGAEDLD